MKSGVHIASDASGGAGNTVSGAGCGRAWVRVSSEHEHRKSVRLNGTVRITPEARQYAVGEQARRAGVPFSFFQKWRTVWAEDRMILEIANGSLKRISFPYAPAWVMKDLSEGTVGSGRALWMSDAKRYSFDDLVIPFLENKGVKRPLFRLADENHLECAYDLPVIALLTLSRWEETLPNRCDAHGRFIAANSIACRGGFLDRPIVDEYGLAFEQGLEALFPSWKKQDRDVHVKLSMDADHVGIPFRWKTALRHTTHYRNPLGSGRDIIGWIRGGETTELRAMREGVLLAHECNLKTAVYWKASPPGPRDSGYDPRDPRLRKMIQWLKGLGAESGVHAGYNTFRSPERLRREISILREVLGDQPLGGRQHYIRWCPDTWIHWESCGLSYDSSVGFAEQAGFRAGTCVPYRPWLLSLNRQANLLEIPFVAMDRSLLGYMRLTADEAVALITALLQTCKAVGGVFAALWHNNTLLDPAYRAIYLGMLNACSGARSYGWPQESWQAAA